MTNENDNENESCPYCHVDVSGKQWHYREDGYSWQCPHCHAFVPDSPRQVYGRLERHASRWQRALVALAMTGDLAIRSDIDDGVATYDVQCMGVSSSGEDGDLGGPVLHVARELARRAAFAAEEFDEEPEGAES